MLKIAAVTLLAALWVWSPGTGRAAPTMEGLERADIATLSAMLDSGRLTSVGLVEFYTARIRRLNHAGPKLNAVIALNPNAMADARASDEARRAGRPVRALEGIPILLKDNIESADPISTTAGSLALAKNFAGRDAPLVARLRAAGAIILGKTNLSEWANFRSTHATSGWSAVGGLTRNPYALDRTACGSSSGSAAAIAAGLAAAAVGSETDGSITCPSSMNGVVGFKPTLGLIPRTHIVPIAHSQDTAGPIAHSVADARLLASIMAGPDSADIESQSSDLPRVAKAGLAASLAGMRIGVLHFADAYPDVEPTYARVLSRLREAGAVLVDVSLPRDPKLGEDEMLVLETEMKADMTAYLASTPPTVRSRSLADLIAFNNSEPAETRLFGQELFIQSEATKGLNDPAYLAALADSKRLAGPEGIDRVMAQNKLAVLISPTTTPAWKVDLLYGDSGGASAAKYPAIAGYPHVTLPMGLVQGLPVGISVIGGRASDDLVLAVAEASERLSPKIPGPSFPASVDPSAR